MCREAGPFRSGLCILYNKNARLINNLPTDPAPDQGARIGLVRYGSDMKSALVDVWSLAGTIFHVQLYVVYNQCDQKKSPNVYKSCTKMISLEKIKILTPLQKLPKNVRYLGKLIVFKGFEKLPKVQ